MITNDGLTLYNSSLSFSGISQPLTCLGTINDALQSTKDDVGEIPSICVKYHGF